MHDINPPMAPRPIQFLEGELVNMEMSHKVRCIPRMRWELLTSSEPSIRNLTRTRCSLRAHCGPFSDGQITRDVIHFGF